MSLLCRSCAYLSTVNMVTSASIPFGGAGIKVAQEGFCQYRSAQGVSCTLAFHEKMCLADSALPESAQRLRAMILQPTEGTLASDALAATSSSAVGGHADAMGYSSAQHGTPLLPSHHGLTLL